MLKSALMLLTLLHLTTGCIVVTRYECGAHTSEGEAVDGLMCEEMLTRTLRISDEFSDLSKEMIIQGAKDWEVATDGKVKLDWVIVDPENADVVVWHDCPANRLGRKTKDDKILLSPLLATEAESTRSVMSHELGHSFGLGHVDASEPDQVMIQGVPGILITDLDVEHFERVMQTLGSPRSTSEFELDGDVND